MIISFLTSASFYSAQRKCKNKVRDQNITDFSDFGIKYRAELFKRRSGMNRYELVCIWMDK